ncbi:ACP phosphodiesterase [Photobacterium minamisatsumaniensis]|uniref:acyl carrier protein phosphodiesterase n=1 Tax=Photobacterium minamisatsumaniensis TaxID=2910233 RepID=UPI003D0D534C
MNFLAHLHIAEQCNSHLAGNLLADFVKGDPYVQYPRTVADGIKLHRFVDSFIDALPEVRLCRQLFSPTTRRVSGIALDITWDHFLAMHWTQYHADPLPEFIHSAQHEVSLFTENLPDAYQLTMARMWQQNWLSQYQYPETINLTLTRMAQRRPKLYQLAHCPDDINLHYNELEDQFHCIYPQVEFAAREFSSELHRS